MAMMNNVGLVPKSLHQKWQFGVEIDGFTAAYFTKANLPEFEFEDVAFAPGGSIFDQVAAGRVSFSDVTLEMGEPQGEAGDALYEWVEQVVDTLTNSGGVPETYLRDVDIVQFDRTGTEYKRWRLHGAYPKSGNFGELEGGSSDNTIRTLTLKYQYPTKE